MVPHIYPGDDDDSRTWRRSWVEIHEEESTTASTAGASTTAYEDAEAFVPWFCVLVDCDDDKATTMTADADHGDATHDDADISMHVPPVVFVEPMILDHKLLCCR